LQQLCAGLSAAQIDALLRNGRGRLPHPFTAQDRAAGYRYDVAILQAEFSLTQVLDRPVDRARLLRGSHSREPGPRPTRPGATDLRTAGHQPDAGTVPHAGVDRVTPSLHVDYQRSRIKQYHKEGRALRTETTINDARDFRVGKRLHNLPALRPSGFQANRRLLDVQRISQDCARGADAFRRVNEPVTAAGQRASALRFAAAAVQALLSALLVFRLVPRGFSNRDLRDHGTPLLGKAPEALTPGQMTYRLRRLRLHGLIERMPRTPRYRVTNSGWRTALFCTRTSNRLLRPGLAPVIPEAALDDSSLRQRFDQWDAASERWIEDQKVPA
jgi:hypothetical protein